MAEPPPAGGAGLGALGYLASRSARNFLRVRLGRLKEPRYAISMLAGLLYLGFWWGQALVLGGGARASVPSATRSSPSELLFVGLFLVAAGFAWLRPGVGVPLRFTEAEIHWLFAGPFSRPLLVLYKIAARVPATLLSSAFLGIWRVLGGGGPGDWLRATLGAFLVFFTLDLHVRGAALTRLRAREKGIGNVTFSLLALAAATLVLAAVLGPVLASAAPPGSAVELGERLQRSPGAILLVPVRAVARPLATVDATEFVLALPAALGVLALHLLWLISIRVRFEDLAVDAWLHSLDAARPERAPAAGDGSPAPVRAPVQPFRLAARGPAELAILWKNLIAGGRFFRARSLTIALVFVGVLWLAGRLSPAWVERVGELHGLGAKAGLAVAVLLFLTGTSMMRNDLRVDLHKLEILKSLPLSGPRLVLGEVAAPFVILVGAIWLLLGLAASSPPGHPMPRSLLLVMAILTPGLVALSLVVQNAAAVLFPAWVGLGPEGSRGFGGVGQGVLVSLGRTFVMMLAFVPAGVLALGVLSAGRAFGAPRPGALAALAALVVLAVEAGLGVWLVGRRFEELEPDEETRAA